MYPSLTGLDGTCAGGSSTTSPASRVPYASPRVTFCGDIEADACGIGYGGFFIVGHTMFFFAGLWSSAEVAPFNDTGEKTLNTNVFEL
jgi:hypothetical protein